MPASAAAMASSYPDASDALVVFVHGLCETEDYWLRKRRPRRSDVPEPGSYGRRLEADEGWSPVFIRANTGISIAESGVALSALLGRLIELWPTPVRRIALVGHSMGGLHAWCFAAAHPDRVRGLVVEDEDDLELGADDAPQDTAQWLANCQGCCRTRLVGRQASDWRQWSGPHE